MFPLLSHFFNPPVSPLVLDLDGDGVELVSLATSRALFDLDSDGYAQHTGWVAPDDALLALDRNSNGRIDNITEVFGNATTDGFTELRALDSNNDGTIDSSDTKFGELRLWRDLNGNGWSEANELQSLADAGVVSIDLNAATSDTTIAGHRISHTSTFTKTGDTTGTIVDAWFENDRHISAYLPAAGFALHDDVKVLPNLMGFGVVPSLWVAMTLDAGLRQKVRELMQASDTLSLDVFRARVEVIVLDWTGADSVDSHSRGPNMDARHLAAMEALAGSGFRQFGGSNPGPTAGAALEADFQTLIDFLTVRLLAQSAVSSYLVDVADTAVTAALSDVYAHDFVFLGSLTYNLSTNELGGRLEDILEYYVGAHAAGSTPPLDIESTIALLSMLRSDFGSDATAYRAAIEAAFVAAGFAETVAAGYADRAAEPLLRVINGTTGDDTIRGFSRDDAIAGGDGADTIRGLRGDDTLEGGAGDDTLHGGDGDDTLAGGADDDTLYGESDDDRLTGGAGDDTLHGGTGSDRYVFNRGDGADTIEDNGSSLGTDRLAIHGYTPAQVTVSRVTGDSDDVVLTFAGTEDRITIRNTLEGSRSDTIERIEFDDGTAWTPGDVRALLFASEASAGDDTIRGFSTADTIAGLAGADTLWGLRGDDTLRGGAGDDVLRGGHDDDTLEGGADDDTLHGEGDDDSLTGGTGDDTLHGGYGSDTYVFNRGDGADTIEDNGSRSTDRLVIHGYTPAQVTVGRVTGDSDDLVLTFAGTSDRITIRNTLDGSRSDTIERIEFDDGTAWTPADVLTLLLAGTTGDDTIRGFSTADTIAGLGGADTLWGLRGDDTLRGGAGDDVLRGGHDDDTLEGGADDDTLYGEGDDDRLTGGAGDDTLDGGYGSDTYVFNRGDGADTIEDNGSRSTDRLVIHGYTPAQVTVSRVAGDSDDVVLTFAGTEDRITIRNTLEGSRSDTIERIEFDDGTVWTPADVRALLFASEASGGDDTIRGFSTADTIAGLGGADTLWGLRGDDTLRGGAGDDVLRGGHDDDTLEGGADDDTLYGEGDDDRLTGGAGDDTLDGGYGSDTYVFNRGDGADTIEDNGSKSTDRLVIHGYTPAQVTVGRVAGDSDDVVLTFAGTGDRITIRNTLEGSRSDTIERIEFDDGTVWTPADVRALLLAGTTGDDTIRGFSTADTIAGGAGDDTLRGEGGHDTIRGDGGDDVLYGGAGNDDLYGGDDNDVLHGSLGLDSFDGGAGSDTIDFSYSTSDADLDLAAGRVTFSGGTVERLVSIENVIGTGGANTITGTDGANRLDGGAGNDTLEGAGGNDVLLGGAGADTFIFNADDGVDTIEDFEDGLDIIRFKIAGLTFAGLTITEDGDDVLIAYDGMPARLCLRRVPPRRPPGSMRRLAHAPISPRPDAVLERCSRRSTRSSKGASRAWRRTRAARRPSSASSSIAR